jgi:DNA repair exonuclease SbcCD ATPase subunit
MSSGDLTKHRYIRREGEYGTCGVCGGDAETHAFVLWDAVEHAERALAKYMTTHEKCIEEIQADQLTLAERENELHDAKDRKLAQAEQERDHLKVDLQHQCEANNRNWTHREELSLKLTQAEQRIKDNALDAANALVAQYQDGIKEGERRAEQRVRALEGALKYYADRAAWTEVETTFAYAPHEWAFDWPGDFGDHPWSIAAAALPPAEGGADR